MKITEIRTYLMQAGPPSLVSKDTKLGMWHKSARNWLFVKVMTDSGLYGVGECSGWPRVIETAVRDLSNVLLGEDPADIERLWHTMQGAIMGHGMTGVVGGGAIAGIDMALWDIKGKSLGTPVWNLLGGKVRGRIPVYGHAKDAESALELKSRGIKAVKLGGAHDLVKRVSQVRDACGADLDVMVDLAGPPWLTAADAITLTRALEKYELLFVEDPIAPEMAHQYARLRDHVSLPLAAGERMTGLLGMRDLIEKELVDVIQPDTGRAGGISQMKKIAALAEGHGIMVAPHSGSLGPVAEFAALHIMAAIPNALMLERVENDWEGRNQVITTPPIFDNGALIVPDAPGLGVDIVEEEVAKHPSIRNVALGGGAQFNPGTESERVYVQTRLGRYKFTGRNT